MPCIVTAAVVTLCAFVAALAVGEALLRREPPPAGAMPVNALLAAPAYAALGPALLWHLLALSGDERAYATVACPAPGVKWALRAGGVVAVAAPAAVAVRELFDWVATAGYVALYGKSAVVAYCLPGLVLMWWIVSLSAILSRADGKTPPPARCVSTTATRPRKAE